MYGDQPSLFHIKLFGLVNGPLVKSALAQGVALGLVLLALFFELLAALWFKGKDVGHSVCPLAFVGQRPMITIGARGQIHQLGNLQHVHLVPLALAYQAGIAIDEFNRVVGV